MKTGDVFRLFVLSAILKADSAAIREKFGVRKIRFATADELKEMTGLVPGSVPPFGPPILPFELYADTSITANDKIAFNAGSLEDSIILNVADWLRAARPEVFSFAAAARRSGRGSETGLTIFVVTVESVKAPNFWNKGSGKCYAQKIGVRQCFPAAKFSPAVKWRRSPV